MSRKKDICGTDFCRACNGLSLFIRIHANGKTQTLNYAKEITGIDQVYLVMGGFHLAPPEVTDRISPTLTDLGEINPT